MNLTRGKEDIIVSIRDNGIGISKEDLQMRKTHFKVNNKYIT